MSLTITFLLDTGISQFGIDEFNFCKIDHFMIMPSKNTMMPLERVAATLEDDHERPNVSNLGNKRKKIALENRNPEF